MNTRTAKFDIGQLVRHRTLPLRGVVVDVDARDENEDETVYHVLAEGQEAVGAILSEHNLEADTDRSPLNNPAASRIFAGFVGGRYRVASKGLH